MAFGGSFFGGSVVGGSTFGTIGWGSGGSSGPFGGTTGGTLGGTSGSAGGFGSVVTLNPAFQFTVFPKLQSGKTSSIDVWAFGTKRIEGAG